MPAQADTVGYWRFEEGVVDQAAPGGAGAILDSSINAKHGTAFGGPIYRSSPVPGSVLALEFDGAGDHIKIADDPVFQLPTEGGSVLCINRRVDQAAPGGAGAILDSSINAKHGTAFGGPIYRSSPVPGSVLALEFDGAGDHIKIADDPVFQLPDSLTIEACVRIDSFPVGQFALKQILFRGDNRSGFDPYYLGLIEINGVDFATFLIQDAGNSGIRVNVDVSALGGQMIHLAATLDGTTGDMSIYLNGVLGSTINTAIRPAGGLVAGQNPGLAIGSLQNGAGQFFDGLIDEARLSDMALSPEEFLTTLVGGAITGDSPGNSVVNKYMQSWDVPNLFVVGASAFPQISSFNPTGTVGALAYLAADAIKTRYQKNPGPLAQAVIP